MAKTFKHNLTPEKLAAMDRKAVELVRERAVRHSATDLIAMCEADLSSRPMPAERQRQRTRAPRDQKAHSPSAVVTGYHFVCARDRGVTLVDQGRFWSGSWVVAEANVRASLKYESYLALHESKSDRSYRQGKLLDYRRSARDMLPNESAGTETKTEEGIEFFVQETSEPYDWIGAGAGEKGYRWTEVAVLHSSEPEKSEPEPT
jgi:hypothetical protein